MRSRLAKGSVLLLLLSQIHISAFASKSKPKKVRASEIKNGSSDEKSGNSGKAGSVEKDIYSYHLAGPAGDDVPLASFKGKVILLVNLARESSYHTQLPALIKLSNMYKDKGLVVIGVPSNDFGACEPGTDADIQKAYKIDGKVPFPIMGRSTLIGEEEIPLYSYLTKGKDALPGGDVHWNYTKFLIGRNGRAIARFKPDVSPDSPEILAALDEVFSGTYKPALPKQRTPPHEDEADTI